MSPSRSVTLAQVLARIEAATLPDVEVLAELPADELERQLAALGVDVDSEMGELLSAAGGEPALVPLEQLAESDLAALSASEVEARLRREGVDVAGYLARALTLIRSPPAADRDRSDSRRRRAAPHDARTRRERRPRGLPRAVAASVIAVSIAGVVFTVVHQHGTLSTPVAEQRGSGADAPGAVAKYEAPVAEQRDPGADDPGAVANLDAPVAKRGLKELAGRAALRSIEPDRQASGGGTRRHAGEDEDRRESLELARARDAARLAARALTTAEQPPAAELFLEPAAAPREPASSNVDRALRGLATDAPARSAARSRLGASESDAHSTAPDPVAAAVELAAAQAHSAQRAEQSKQTTSGPDVGAGRTGSGVGSAAAADTSVQQLQIVGARPQQGEVVSVTLAPGETLAQALAPLTLARQDRDALVALLSAQTAVAAGRLRLLLDGGRVLSAELERGGSAVVRVRRSASGALQRSP